ncbi:hypothetical protein MWQ_13823 [Acinetobacter seifertii]|nr:hypothetical protein MWQ_13823 [Acinetobacter seifertii]
MKCSYQDLDGNRVHVTCESYIHIPLGVGKSKIAVDNSSEDLIHINEDFSFFKKQRQIQFHSIDSLLIVKIMFLIAMNYLLWHKLELIGKF